MSKERPILFSGAMVRAILDGRKSQTRRAAKPQPKLRDIAGAFASWVFFDKLLHPNAKEAVLARCPYGVPGDRLWVREAYRVLRIHDLLAPRELAPEVEVFYDADELSYLGSALAGRRRPGMFMMRWMARVVLEITDVRVERLQDISYEDACAEGCGSECDRFEAVANGETWKQTARRLRWPQRSYELLWNEINGKGAWDANPFVWALTFKRITT